MRTNMGRRRTRWRGLVWGPKQRTVASKPLNSVAMSSGEEWAGCGGFQGRVKSGMRAAR